MDTYAHARSADLPDGEVLDELIGGGPVGDQDEPIPAETRPHLHLVEKVI